MNWAQGRREQGREVVTAKKKLWKLQQALREKEALALVPVNRNPNGEGNNRLGDPCLRGMWVWRRMFLG